MANKQTPETGKRYDEATHQWIDAAPVPAKAPAKPAPESTPQPDKFKE